MRRRVHPVSDIREVAAFEMSASDGAVLSFISPASNVLSSNEDEVWHSFRLAPVTLHIDLGMNRRVRWVCLLPSMKPSTAIVRHSLTLWDYNKQTTHVYNGPATDRKWIRLELNDRASSIDITTTHSPSWVSWRQIKVFESM